MRDFHSPKATFSGRAPLLFSLIFVLFFLMLQQAFSLGVQADEGVHITMANEVARGQTIYLDRFENKMPASELLMAGLVKMGARPVETGRLLSIGAMLISGLSLMAITQLILTHASQGLSRRTIQLAGFATLILFYLSPLNIFWSRLFLLESFVIFFASLSALFLLRAIYSPHPQPVRWFVSGLLLGFAILFKQTAVVTVTAYAVFVIGYSLYIVLTGKRSFGTACKHLLIWAAGLLLPLIGFALFLISQGAFAQFRALASGSDRIAPLDNIAEKLAVFWEWGRKRPLFPLTIMSGLLALPRLLKREFAPLYLPLLWLGAELTAIFLPPELGLSWGGFSHYILPTLAASSLLVGLGIGFVFDRVSFGPVPKKAWLAGALLLALLTLWGWGNDLNHVLFTSTYPMSTQAEEKRIGRILASYIPEEQGALVFGNTIFYHWAERPPLPKFFHYPGYFAELEIGRTADAELVPILTHPADHNLNALLVSGYHLQVRLPDTILDPIFAHWEPVARLSYPYQRDAFLFLPRTPLGDPTADPLAIFEQKIALQKIVAQNPIKGAASIQLTWHTLQADNPPYAVFVHLIKEDQTRIAQHDGQPVQGFYPTQLWQEGEVISDFHWLNLPPHESINIETDTLAVGLYNPETGERLIIDAETGQSEYRIPLREVMQLEIIK